MNPKILLSALGAGMALGMLVILETDNKSRKKINELLKKMKKRWKGVKDITMEELKEIKETFHKDIAGLNNDMRKKVLSILELHKPMEEIPAKELVF